MNRKIAVAVCGVVLVVALVTLWVELKPDTVEIPRQETIGIQTGLSQVLVEEAAKVVPNHGHVVVFTASTPAQLKERSNYLWSALIDELQKRSISITATESVFNAWNSGSMPADRAAFGELLAERANVDALVFLLDLPDWGIVSEAFTRYEGPKIIAMDNLHQRMKSRYGGYFASGMLVALIGARNQTATSLQPKTPREWFDRFYQVYTAQNYESLPE